MADDDMKGLARYLLYAFGVPSGLFAVGGVFSIGMAIYRGNISLGDKQFVLGAFLLSVAFSLWQLPKIFFRSYYDLNERKQHWAFSWTALFWTAVSVAAAYYLGLLLYPMI